MNALIFGDIHGNLPALEKLLDNEGVDFDMIICHGDVVNYGPWSNETVQLLDQLENLTVLKGNHEEFFLRGNYEGSHPVANKFFEFCYPSFNSHSIIENYSNEVKVGNYIVKHTIKDKYIFEDTAIKSLDANYIIGHSHYQFSRKISQYSLINTGSVGQNRQYINLISYLTYNLDSGEVLLKNIKYDHKYLIREMKSRGYPKDCVAYYQNKNIY